MNPSWCIFCREVDGLFPLTITLLVTGMPAMRWHLVLGPFLRCLHGGRWQDSKSLDTGSIGRCCGKVSSDDDAACWLTSFGDIRSAESVLDRITAQWSVGVGDLNGSQSGVGHGISQGKWDEGSELFGFISETSPERVIP